MVGLFGRRRQSIGFNGRLMRATENATALARLRPHTNADYPLRGRSLATPLFEAAAENRKSPDCPALPLAGSNSPFTTD